MVQRTYASSYDATLSSRNLWAKQTNRHSMHTPSFDTMARPRGVSGSIGYEAHWAEHSSDGSPVPEFSWFRITAFEAAEVLPSLSIEGVVVRLHGKTREARIMAAHPGVLLRRTNRVSEIGSALAQSAHWSRFCVARARLGLQARRYSIPTASAFARTYTS